MRGASPEDPQALVVDRPSPADEVLVSVVVPTYREADNLPLLVPRITAALEPWPHEIIIVDDNSNDGTDQAVATLSEQRARGSSDLPDRSTRSQLGGVARFF